MENFTTCFCSCHPSGACTEEPGSSSRGPVAAVTVGVSPADSLTDDSGEVGDELALVGSLVRNTGVVDVSAEEASFLNHGRVVDLARMRGEFGFEPRFTSAEAVLDLLDHLASRRAFGRPVLGALARAQQALTDRAASVVGAR